MTISTENTETLLALHSPLPDLAVKDLILEIWLYLADRRVDKAMDILERQLADLSVAETGEIPRIPTPRAVYNWVKRTKFSVCHTSSAGLFDFLPNRPVRR